MKRAELIAARKKCRICVEREPGAIRSADEFAFDPAVVSHWSQWLGHDEPELLIVGQDFGNTAYFRAHEGSDAQDSRTNNHLREMLSYAGVLVSKPPVRDQAARVFLTNAILCLKEGPMNAPVKPRSMTACAREHLVPLSAHLRAPITVGMGGPGWNAVRLAFGLITAPRPFVVTFPDLERGVTQGETEAEALEMAEDCLVCAIGLHIRSGKLPAPKVYKGKEYRAIRLPALAAMKAELYLAFQSSGIRKSELARRLDISKGIVDRLFDVKYNTRLDQMEAAFVSAGSG